MDDLESTWQRSADIGGALAPQLQQGLNQWLSRWLS